MIPAVLESSVVDSCGLNVREIRTNVHCPRDHQPRTVPTLYTSALPVRYVTLQSARL